MNPNYGYFPRMACWKISNQDVTVIRLQLQLLVQRQLSCMANSSSYVLVYIHTCLLYAGLSLPLKDFMINGMQHGHWRLEKAHVSLFLFFFAPSHLQRTILHELAIQQLIYVPAHMLPPYVEILVIHTKLSTYSGVINHPTAPLEVKRFFHAAGLSSALNVMRAAIQGESQLKSMPNNTVIMISFAACSALSLAATPADSRSNLAPSIQNLIEETAGVLERIGVTPSHRNGASVLYGRFLRMLIRRSFPQTQTEPGPQRIAQSGSLHDPLAMDRYNPSITVSESQYSPDSFWTEPLHFSAMSDHQIVDAVNRVNRVGTAFGRPIPDIQLDNIMNWDWLDLPNVTEFGF